MKTRILPLVAFSAALCACPQENHVGPEFLGICANPAPDAEGCSYSPTCDQIALFNYHYDPTVASELLVPIELFNQLADNSDPSSGRLNTNDAVIQQWRFEYVYGGVMVATGAANQTLVVPAGSHTVGLVPVIPAELNAWAAGMPPGDIVVNVRAAGRYADERYFESGPFRVVTGVISYAPPISCTAPEILLACPQVGQSGTYGCVAP